MHVRLVRPMLVEITRLDTTATKATGGYDQDFKTVRVAMQNGKRVALAKYQPPVRLRGQIEDQTRNALRMLGAGNSPDSKMAVVFDYRDLVLKGLTDRDSGEPLIHVNDMLTAILSPCGSRPVFRIKPPGLYAVEVRPASMGLDGSAGIVVVRFNDRQLSEAPG